jgi:uncharacterized membrane protein
MRVSASSIISSVADTKPTPARCRPDGEPEAMRESVPSGVRLSVLRPAFVATSIAWALILPLASWVASASHVTAWSASFVIAVYGVGSLVCHQLPQRSFRLFSAQMPVCARCTGIYVGAAVAAVVSAFGHGRAVPDHRWDSRLVLSVAALPCAITLVAEWTTGVMPSNLVRAAAGLPLGAGVAWLVMTSTREDAARPPDRSKG